MLLSYVELLDVYKNKYIAGAEIENINGSSIDIRLDETILLEQKPDCVCPNCNHSWMPRCDNFYDYSRRDEAVVCPECHHTNSLSCFIPSVDPARKEQIKFKKYSCKNNFILWPGEVCLASSIETFNLPANITAEYVLKSSMARIFLEHLFAGFCDPMWSNSRLTLEFVNLSKYHPIKLSYGMKCGQMRFHQHTPVPFDKSYAVRGQYSNQLTATASKGVK